MYLRCHYLLLSLKLIFFLRFPFIQILLPLNDQWCYLEWYRVSFSFGKKINILVFSVLFSSQRIKLREYTRKYYKNSRADWLKYSLLLIVSLYSYVCVSFLCVKGIWNWGAKPLSCSCCYFPRVLCLGTAYNSNDYSKFHHFLTSYL